MQLPFLTEDDLNGLGISTAEVIQCIEDAICGQSMGRVWNAPKAVISHPSDGRYMMAALAAMDAPSVLSVKTIVLNPDNPNHGLPQINGLVTLLDSMTGLPLAIVDGNWVTAVRTAGLSAVAAKYLANPKSETIGFVGTGAQALSHLTAFAEIFPIRHIRFFGRGQPNKNRLLAQASRLGITARDCQSAQVAIEDVDMVVTSITHTASIGAILDMRRTKMGVFLSAVDLAVSLLPESLFLLDRLVIDDIAQEAALTNKLCAPELVQGDLSALVLGKAQGRANAQERTAFLFRGHALADLALASLAWQKYQQKQA